MSDFARFIRSRKHKNSKFFFYIKHLWHYMLPRVLSQRRLSAELAKIDRYDPDYIVMRVNYYNRLTPETVSTGWWLDPDKNPLAALTVSVGDFHWEKRWKTSLLFFDLYEQIRFFPSNGTFAFSTKDDTEIPPHPMLLKARPIARPGTGIDNANSVLLKLDALRHFTYVRDQRTFAEKQNRLVGRAAVYQPHRIQFYEHYFGHPLCDLGQTNHRKTAHPEWNTPKMPMDDHLGYKFILCLEGNDVASNLKWVMSSNSLAVMPRPKWETWFMEGNLQPDVHYVAIKDDYSDLEERLHYYIEHPDEAQQIIENAHRYVDQFRDEAREKLISLLVIQKYFTATGQAAIFN